MASTIEPRAISTTNLADLPGPLAWLIGKTGAYVEFHGQTRRLVGFLWFGRFYVIADLPSTA